MADVVHIYSQNGYNFFYLFDMSDVIQNVFYFQIHIFICRLPKDGTRQNTKKLGFTLLSAFFNFVKNLLDSGFQNPCDNTSLRNLFRAGKTPQLKILDKDVVDEIIFRTENSRNRLVLELMARSGMRVGAVLKLTPADIEDRKFKEPVP